MPLELAKIHARWDSGIQYDQYSSVTGLDSVIDRVLVSVKEAVVEAGLDPLPVPDINIPYSLDK